MLSLIPVVEFEPGRYSTRDREYPTVTSTQDPLAWDRYWRESLTDAGINELDPIHQGSWLVPASTLTRPSTLRALLRVAFEDIHEWDLDSLSALCGGYVLAQADFRMEPGCCGDLSNLDEWRAAAESRDAEWQMVWIGHPWTFVSAEGESLTFLDPTEEDPPVTSCPVISVDRVALRKAIDVAAAEVCAFGRGLLPYVAEFNPSCPVEHVVRVLTLGHEGPLSGVR